MGYKYDRNVLSFFRCKYLENYLIKKGYANKSNFYIKTRESRFILTGDYYYEFKEYCQEIYNIFEREEDIMNDEIFKGDKKHNLYHLLLESNWKIIMPLRESKHGALFYDDSDIKNTKEKIKLFLDDKWAIETKRKCKVDSIGFFLTYLGYVEPFLVSFAEGCYYSDYSKNVEKSLNFNREDPVRFVCLAKVFEILSDLQIKFDDMDTEIKIEDLIKLCES